MKTYLTHPSPFSVSSSVPTGPGALCRVATLVAPSSPLVSPPIFDFAHTFRLMKRLCR